MRATNIVRIKPELLVVVGICSHLGCSPTAKFQPGAQPSLPDDWAGGFLCPCHGSTFDLAGRVFKNKPAPDNLRSAALHVCRRHQAGHRQRRERRGIIMAIPRKKTAGRRAGRRQGA